MGDKVKKKKIIKFVSKVPSQASRPFSVLMMAVQSAVQHTAPKSPKGIQPPTGPLKSPEFSFA